MLDGFEAPQAAWPALNLLKELAFRSLLPAGCQMWEAETPPEAAIRAVEFFDTGWS